MQTVIVDRSQRRMRSIFGIMDSGILHHSWGLFDSNYDACGLFRALHSHNPTQYSHIVGLASHFYVTG